MEITQEHQQYWKKNLRLCAALLYIWFLMTFVMIWFARDLANFSFFGWPLSFYMAAQGSLAIYVILVWFYAKRMDELDKEYGIDES